MAEHISNSLINLGGLAKPIDTFIQKISGAIGILYEPKHIRRLAKANVEAKIITYKGDMELSELQRRAGQRLMQQEERRQGNIEDVIEKAIPLLEDGARPENIDDDWVAHFFRESQDISDESMKELWSKILAGEANKPGTYSRRTINILGSMSQRDAEKFKIICKFVCFIDNKANPLIYDFDSAVYINNGLNFDVINNLVGMGLMIFEPSNGIVALYNRPSVEIKYGDIKFILSNKSPNGSKALAIEAGRAVFTDMGRELSSISGLTYNDNFSDYIYAFFKRKYMVVRLP